jgi:hypothetical protein
MLSRLSLVARWLCKPCARQVSGPLYQAKREDYVGMVNMTAPYRRARRMAQDSVRVAFAAHLRT